MWGGGTCTSCGTEVDKWGRLLPPTPSSSLDRAVRWVIRTPRRRRISATIPFFFLMLFVRWFAEDARPPLFVFLLVSLLNGTADDSEASSGWMMLLASAAWDTAVLAVLMWVVTKQLYKRFPNRSDKPAP
jgi:hypothetical protein